MLNVCVRVYVCVCVCVCVCVRVRVFVYSWTYATYNNKYVHLQTYLMLFYLDY